MPTLFPPVDCIRNAINANPPNKLEFYKRYEVPPHWLYSFMKNGYEKRKSGNAYEHIARVVNYLETECGVTFKEDGTFTQ